MSIHFSFKNNIQVLKFADQLSQAEFAQVILKIEEKSKQGRKLYLFQLEQFPNQDEAAKAKIVNLIKYCFQHNLSLALCVPQKFWSLYSAGSLPLAKMFTTESEASIYLEGIGKAADEKPLDIQETKKRDTDELLKKYELFHKIDELDPYHLKNMAEIYSLVPSIEAIQNLEKATIDIEKRRENILRLDLQCAELAKQAMDMAIARNQALNSTELALKKVQVDERAGVLSSYQKIYAQKISELSREIAELDLLINQVRS